MCKTKIVATLGPASSSPEMLTEMIRAGVNVVRLNFSHGTANEHAERAALVRSIARDLNKNVAILADLQGPKIRIACFKHGPIHLTKGDVFYLDGLLGDHDGYLQRVGLDYPELIDDLKVDDVLLLDDGRVQLRVIEVAREQRWVKTKALNNGKLSDRKGINLLGGGLSAPALTEKDKADILTAAKIQADFVAVSFPRNSRDIAYARQLVQQAGSDAHIIAKVERAEVVASELAMDEVIQASDAIMVARGDLGVEIGDARLAFAQKKLIERAQFHGKPVITATQMMESMIDNPLPTRAEVLDVANAIIDGTDAVMLSAESAAGAYPLESVQAMVRIAQGAEADLECKHNCWDELQHLCSEPGKSFALSSMISASKVHKDLGVAILTQHGETPRLMSRCQSKAQIWALSDQPRLLAKLALLRGVTPVYFSSSQVNSNELPTSVAQCLQNHTHLAKVSSLLITQLESLEGSGDVNVCRLLKLQDNQTHLKTEREIAA
ncbi:pyruvate kinase [Vibrio panuliri]|uniref:Pyruvate kinase n=1 Tax=Vibrio panuliri TaxID=1381081 RepID=A0A1Q9HN27_9VIBR|nr:pyruvate kinase [Vibrio panuliri]OLQ92130.1 pyruvate kinase [Vibrio panuliri]